MASRTLARRRSSSGSSSTRPRTPSMAARIESPVARLWRTLASAAFCAARAAPAPGGMKHCSSYPRIPSTSASALTWRNRPFRLLYARTAAGDMADACMDVDDADRPRTAAGKQL
eukprot:scaffold16733_cov112-Isochrysis_galbana.AAC.6